MSITKIRNFMPATCGIVFGIVVVIALVVGMFLAPGQRAINSEWGETPVAFKVGDYEVKEGEIGALIRAEESRFAGKIPTPFETLSAHTRALVNAIDRAIIFRMLEDEGIDFDPNDIEQIKDVAVKKAKEEFDEQMLYVEITLKSQIMNQERELEKMKKEKGVNSKEAKEAEQKLKDLREMTVAQMFKQQTGMTPEQAFSFLSQNRLAELSSEDVRQTKLKELAQWLIENKYAESVDTSEETIRKSYDFFTYQELLISKANNPDPVKKAEDVLKRIREGMDFGTAVVQFSDRAPAPNQKPEEAGTLTFDRLTVETNGLADPLFHLKPGEISGVISRPEGAAIYKLVKIEPKIPPNFDRIKNIRAAQMRKYLKMSKFARNFEARLKNTKFEWKNPAYKVLYDYDGLRRGERFQSLQGAEKREERMAAYREVLNRAKELLGKYPDLMAPVLYACLNQIDIETFPGKEKEKLKEEKLQVYAEISQYIPSPIFRFEYVNLLLDAKQGDAALEQLLEIIRTAYDPTEENKALITQVEQLFPRATNYAKKDSPLIAEIQKELKQWKENEAEKKRMEAEAAKRLEEERKKAEQEVKKQEANKQPEKAKTPPKPAPTLPKESNKGN